MARTVDPVRHQARRLVIIDAALTCFAARGYEGATTAAICREAGIGSGTLFHYFPTKQAILLATLELGTQENEDWFAAQEGRRDGLGVLMDYVTRTEEEYADPRVPGFVRAVGSVMAQPDVAAALARDDQVLSEGLVPWVAAAQESQEIRTDLPPDLLTQWLLALLDGFLGRLAAADGLQADDRTLVDMVARILRP